MVCDDLFGYRSAKMEQLFSDNVIAKIKAHKPGFTIAGNNGGFMGTKYVKRYAFDFHYSDNNYVPTPGRWWAETKAHRALKSAVLLHPNRPISKQTHRQMIALGYANGAHVITPWDEYIHGKGRLFADPADFADLYAFIRALGQAGYLNGYEDAAVGGHDLKDNRYGDATPISVTGGSGKLSVFARAKPGEAEAPIVLHLVEAGDPKAATLRLRVSSLFGTDDVTCTLLTPKAYNEAAHETAVKSGKYGALAREAVLKATADDSELVVDIPPLSPWGVLVVSPATQNGQTFRDMAKPRPQVAGAPLPSDVCLSSRWRHPRNEDDPHDTFETGDAFHATRLDWVYSLDPQWIKSCRDRGYRFGATLNSDVSDTVGSGTREKGRIRNKNGDPVTAPWMVRWKAWWGCVNAPSYQEAFLAHALRIVDGGADVIHVDDPGFNATAVHWGGCFCQHCQAKAKAQGVDLDDKKQMEAFQRVHRSRLSTEICARTSMSEPGVTLCSRRITVDGAGLITSSSSASVSPAAEHRTGTTGVSWRHANTSATRCSRCAGAMCE
jgi:hypothetical protein